MRSNSPPQAVVDRTPNKSGSEIKQASRIEPSATAPNITASGAALRSTTLKKRRTPLLPEQERRSRFCLGRLYSGDLVMGRTALGGTIPGGVAILPSFLGIHKQIFYFFEWSPDLGSP
jgi:hypothetical protein